MTNQQSARTHGAVIADDDTPVFVISVAAQLAGMHAQTLRQYDRLGLVRPQRTRGGGRRYSHRDVTLLREVQRLSQEEGISLAGVQRILAMAAELSTLREQVREMSTQLEHLRGVRQGARVFAAASSGDVVAVRPGQRPRRPGDERSLVLWRAP